MRESDLRKSKILCSIIATFNLHSAEIALSRIINPDSAGKERSRLTKSIVLAVRELALQTEIDSESRDLAAFIVLALEKIAGTIDISVAAWEKRDYWVKADKFRMEWAWSGRLSKIMREALRTDDWNVIAKAAAQVAGKLNKITVSSGNRRGKPWVGAWEVLRDH